MRYLRAVADGEWREIQRTGHISPSGSAKPPYPENTVVYLHTEDTPANWFWSWAESSFFEDGANAVHVVAVTLTPEQEANIEADRSAITGGRQMEHTFVHRGAIEVAEGQLELLVTVLADQKPEEREAAIENALENWNAGRDPGSSDGAKSSIESGIWRVPDGAKFAMLAIKTSSLPASREGMIVFNGGARVLFQTPIPPPDLLTRWFGSLRADQFRESNLVIVVSEQSSSPGILDEQSHRLETRAKEIFLGVLLQGAPFGFRGGTLFSGEFRSGELETRQMTIVQRVNRVAGAKTFRLSEVMIQDAGRVAATLRDRVMAGGFRRLRGGFASWHGAVLEASPSERLHGFVRSLDGVMILPQGEGKKMFRRRGQVLLGPSKSNDELLGELYDLRSTASHLNDFEGVLSDYPAEGRNVVGFLRAFQAEVLATEVYRRILLSDELLDKMKDDDSIKQLWELDESELRQFWGSPIDLDSECRARFVDGSTGAFPEVRLLTRAPGGSNSSGAAAAHNPRTGA